INDGFEKTAQVAKTIAPAIMVNKPRMKLPEMFQRNTKNLTKRATTIMTIATVANAALNSI
ncbi:hypothetical protein, partial [Xenorhabdus bovienii]|uniref:hypothetical protein n=1 Tax=Xenorhabdus bovienii TaxID=40576 RepID=UPI0023B2E9E5